MGVKWNVTGLRWRRQRSSYWTDPPEYSIDRLSRRCYEAFRLGADGHWVSIFRGRISQCQVVCEMDQVQRVVEQEELKA